MVSPLKTELKIEFMLPQGYKHGDVVQVKEANKIKFYTQGHHRTNLLGRERIHIQAGL